MYLCNLEIYRVLVIGWQGIEVQKHKAAKAQRYKGTEAQRHRGPISKVQSARHKVQGARCKVWCKAWCKVQALVQSMAHSAECGARYRVWHFNSIAEF